jgi:hypothetical protein
MQVSPVLQHVPLQSCPAGQQEPLTHVSPALQQLSPHSLPAGHMLELLDSELLELLDSLELLETGHTTAEQLPVS